MFASSRRDHAVPIAVSVDAGPRVPAWQNRAGILGLLFLLSLLAVRYVIFVQPRAMEFDQICTLMTAEAKSWHEYIAAVPADSQPPFSHIAARLGLLLPLPEPIAIHLISALVLGLAAVCIFRLFQRRGAPLAGLCGAALFAASRGVEYMFTIRPYATLVGISAVSVLVYDAYRSRRAAGARATLWPLAIVIVIAATIHALSLVYVLLPIVAGELLYGWQTRRVDGRLLLAAGLASTAFGFDFTLARQIQTHYMSLVPMSARTPGIPTVAKLVEVMTSPVERRWQALLLLASLVATVVLWRRSRARVERRLVRTTDMLYPVIAAVALYAASILAFCMGALNHYFFTRYASPVYLCGALLLGFAFSITPWRRYPAVPFAIAIGVILLPLPALRTFARDQSRRTPAEENAAIFQPGDIIASPLAFPTIWWYATPEERSHMRVLTDPDRYRTIPDGIPEVVLQRFAAAGVLPFSLTPSHEFQPGKEVNLVSPLLSGDTWVPAALESEGYTCVRDASFQSQTFALTRCIRGLATQ